MKITKKTIKLLIQIAIYSLVAIFFIKTLGSQIDQLSNYKLENIGLIMIATIIYSLSVGFNAYTWHILMKLSEEKIPAIDSMNVYISSYITRYIPGHVVAILSRATLNKEYKVHIIKSVWGWFIENLGFLMIGGLISLFVVSKIISSDIAAYSIIPILIIIGLFVFFKYELFWKYAQNILIKSKKLSIKNISIINFSFQNKIYLLIMYIFSWILWSTNYFLICYSISGINVKYFFVLSGINALSYFIGYVSFIMPSGAGVREVVMVTLLKSLGFITDINAVIISLVARISFIIGEFLYFFVFKVIYLFYKKYE